jgi:hypothetical protein
MWQVLETAGVQICVEPGVFDSLRTSREIATTIGVRRRLHGPPMAFQFCLEVGGRSVRLEPDAVGKIGAVVGAHFEPKLTRLCTIPALHGAHKLLLRRLAVMKQRTSGNSGRESGQRD